MCKNSMQERNGKIMNLLNINDAEKSLLTNVQIPTYIFRDNGKIEIPDVGKVEKVPFVWLAMTISRVLWCAFVPGEKQKPLCKASNAKIPDGGIEMRHNVCASCGDAQWRDGGKQRPSCTMVYTILGWDLERKQPFLFQIKRTGIASLRSFDNAVRIGNLNPGQYPYHLRIKASIVPVEKKNKYKSMFVPSFLIEGEHEQAEEYYHIAMNLSESMQNLRFDGCDDGDGDDDYDGYANPCQSWQSYANPSLPGLPQPDQVAQKKQRLIFETDANWMNTKVGFSKTGNLTWQDLSQDKPLVDGSSGLEYLQKLSKWTEQPGIAETAMIALQYLSQAQSVKDVQPPPSVVA